MSIRYRHSIRRALVVGVTAAIPVLCSGVAHASPSANEIGPGSADSAAVECVQSALVAAAKNGKTTPYDASSVDGKYGPITSQAVKMYQQKLGITEDGIVGPITGTYLYQEMQQDKKQIGDAQLLGCFNHLPTTGDVIVPKL